MNDIVRIEKQPVESIPPTAIQMTSQEDLRARVRSRFGTILADPLRTRAQGLVSMGRRSQVSQVCKCQILAGLVVFIRK